MCVSEGSHQRYKLGEEVQGDYAMQCLIKYDKADVGSPLLEAAPVQVFDHRHSGGTCFTVVVVTNIPCCPSLDHLYFVFCKFVCRGPIWQRLILTGV